MAKRATPSNTSDEARFIAEYDPQAFDRPSITVDIVLLSVAENRLRVSLVRRDAHPDRGHYALPGGFVGADESLDSAAVRVLSKKLKQRKVFLEQLYTFGTPGRDPRMRIVTVAYYALVDAARISVLPNEGIHLATVGDLRAGEKGEPAEVYDDNGNALTLAFDHGEIIGLSVKRIRGKLNYAPIGYQLLAEHFTLRRLQEVHETILGHPVNKDSFRRRMLASGELEATGEYETEVGHRPAELYRFCRRSAV